MGFAPPVAARGCTGGPTPGALALQERVSQSWGSAGLYSLGIYNCRRIQGTVQWSVHSEGRALDVGGPLDSLLASAAADDLLAVLLGAGDGVLQRIMYDGRVYDRQSPMGRPISGGNLHRDHLHIELSWASARQEIPLELPDDPHTEEETMPMLIVAYRGAQFVVDPALTSKRGLADSDDVVALLALRAGAVYVPVELSDAVMTKIPNAV